ncbi:helix-turn-helix domain-containing protein [Planococcus lenghuensis]|uniref:Transcriptional regulator n=1 Tax=Planococcus lenghuensis TaxID=2213202 RepID=A0A1Q2KX09_9BACL|nr:helix-turn-helix transcriptional regulator [Planococcus lenghuensis]AQQ52730.1 transcriptional regulator [Planococcus lenghuensis]
MKDNLHTQLQLARKERNMSLEDLSLKSRVGVARLQAYESGQDVPSAQTLLKLSNALEIPVFNLLDGVEMEEKPKTESV